ncbi:nonribosomal peptide synthase [Paraphaeosphaeria sporulosa]
MDTSSATLCELFAQTVERCPDNLAIDHAQGCLTYRELDNSSTALARNLISLGISKSSSVMLMTAHGALNIIAILAILKTGSYFVPIDRSSWPTERINQVFDIVQSSLVINTTAEPFTPPHGSCRVLDINLVPYTNPLERAFKASTSNIDPEDTACILFTSGSTGRPKGVMLSHKSLCLYSQTSLLNMNIRPGDRILHILSVAFDALCNGGTIVPARPEDLHLKSSSCTVMAATPSLLNHLPIPTSDEKMFSSMHTVILGGETASPNLLGSWIDSGIQIFVAYGLSETTSMGTMHRVERDPNTGNINPFVLGPFMNESPIYLLNHDLSQVVEENVDGEIVIGGGGVAKGYYKDDCKTRDSFINWKGLRVYRTGDYGRWVRGPSGNRLMEFVGRRDRIIKSRGFTVSLDRDVEEQLCLIGVSLGVESVHAIATEAGIIAIVTPSCVDTAALLENARKTMCSYCVPHRVEAIEQFPLSASGKAQSQKILDLIDSIDNNKDSRATMSQVASESFENPTIRVEADKEKLPEVLLAATEALGCSGGNLREITGKDSFVGMGGTSLLAIKLISKLRNLNLHLSVRDLFVCQTFSEVAQRASTILPPDPTARWVAEDPAIARTLAVLRSKACVDLGYDNASFDIGPLTSLQLELALPTLANASMNINQVKLSYGCEHVILAEKAWSAVWRAEPVFRTEISLAIGSGAHIVHKEAIRKPITSTYDDHSNYETAVRNISMSVGLGCRLDFIYYRPATMLNGTGDKILVEKNELTIVLTIHHSLMDGSSLYFLLENVERASKGRSLECSTSSIDANVKLIVTQRMHDQLARSFFNSYLKDVPIQNRAAESYYLVAKTKRSEKVHQTTTAWFTPSVSIETVTDFARSISVSGACIYYCAWAMAISAFEKSDNVVVGSVLSTRMGQAGYDKTIGLYMATLPLVFKFKAEETIKDRLRRTMDDLVRLREFAWVRSDQVGTGHRLGNILALQLPLPDEKSCPPPFRVETLENSDFPLSMLVEADGRLRMLYDDRQFDSACVQRIGEHFKYALCSIINETFVADCMKINRLHETLLANADFLVNEIRDETVKTALERSADRFSQHAAVEDHSGTVLTYEALDKLSNAISHSIIEKLPDANAIAVFGDGSTKWVLSILGVLKTGRRYVPLDPKWSLDRIITVCTESGATALLFPNKGQESEAFGTSGLKVFSTDSILNEEFGKNNFARLPDNIAPDDDLVAVYTSGSTGIPKGIPLTNRGVLALLRSCPEATMFAAPGRRIAQFMSTAFDYCNIELFCTLLHGATLVLRDPCDPYAHLRRVDTATITPSVLTVLNLDDYPNLNLIYSTGEPITSVLVCKFSTRTLLYNVYGPAECSVVTSYTRVIPGDPITVGVAVPTARMYILDESQEPVPEGTKGEIYVAGIQVMRGYLQAQELSSHCVLTDPWHAGELMYRTGDFGVRGQDGRVTYLGRIDRQVKLRGFRVELAEVERTIMSMGENEGMTQCSAVAVNGTLAAFITCSPGKPLLDSEYWITRLQHELRRRLFSASIPQAIIQLERFPMNLNGKVDMKALQRIYAQRMSDREALSVSATTDLVELKVAHEWRQILDLGPETQILSTDNFFSLGGHSVLVLLLANRLSKVFRLDVTLRELLPVPIFQGQVDVLKHLMQVKSTQDMCSEYIRTAHRPGLPAEELTELERLVWHQCQVATTATAFNIAKVLYIEGSVDCKCLVDSFNKALASDPVFRTNIVRGRRIPKRVLSSRAPTVRPVSQLDIEAEVSRQFDLEQEHLIRIFLISDDRQMERAREISTATRVVIITSHVIVDLGSLQRLLHLTSQAYSGATLPMYETPRHLDSDRWTRLPSPDERAWWKDYLKGHGYHDNKPFLLQSSLSPPVSGLFNGASITRQYSGKLVTDLNARVRETGATQHQLALATAALMIQWFSGENDLVLGAPDSGRRSTLDIESCGQFLDRLPIRVKLPGGVIEGQLTTNTVLAEVRDSAHKALANVIPFSHILDSLDFPAESIAELVVSRIPMCECMVTFHTRSAGLNNWLDLHDCKVSESSLFALGSKFPLMLEWSEIYDDEWSLHLEYDTDRIPAATVDSFEKALDVILAVVSQNGTLNVLRERLGFAVD